MFKNKVIYSEFCALVPERLDIILSESLPSYSRNQIQNWIKDGHVTINSHVIMKPKLKTKPKDLIIIQTTLSERVSDEPQNIALNIVYEDDDLLILNKPVGLVTHPGAGVEANTLMNGLLFHCPENNVLPRAGIVHRLDKDTSGIMVVAKTNDAYHALVEAFKQRDIDKAYQALVYGQFKLSKTIDAPIGRHPQQRTKMAVIQKGKSAVSHIKIMKRFQHFTHLEINIETGRTHQIRVHLAHDKHPIIGDHTYGRKPNYTHVHPEIKSWLDLQHSQLLHAYKIAFKHPSTNELLEFEVPLETNFAHGIELFNQYD
ncbi:MAG: RluA family pseudouridine synthase [Pseudomonadota bacterium]|nr:RluA family pseudouridine synthase [Pseudomonadota bacterium]